MIRKILSTRNLIIFLLLAAGLALGLFLTGQWQSKSPGVASPFSRQETYYIETDKPQNPQILQIDLDPFDVKKGEKQTITVKIEEQGIDTITAKSQVMAIVRTDDNSTQVSFELKKAEGTSSLITAWQGSWVCQDSHDKIYNATITASSSQGQSKVDLMFK